MKIVHGSVAKIYFDANNMWFFVDYFSAENLKRQFDKEFGPPWNVVVGETYTCDIDYDSNFLYQFLYGPVAVLAWRVRIFPYY